MQEKKDVVKAGKDEESKVQLEKQGVLKNYSVILASIIVVLAGVHATRSILGPMFLATFFAVLLVSPIKWLRSKGVAGWLSLTSVILAVIAGGVLVATLVATQLAQFAGNIPKYRDRFNEMLTSYNLGFSVDEFLPGFLKSNDKDKEGDKEENVDENAKTELTFNVYTNKSTKKTRDNVRLVSNLEPISATTSAKIADLTVIQDSDDAETFGEVRGGDENRSFFESDVKIDAIIPENPKNGWEKPRDSEGLLLQNPPNVREILTEKGDEKADNIDGKDVDVASGNETQQNEDKKDDEVQNDESEPTGEEERNAAVSAADAVDASSEELFRFLRGLAAELSYLGSDAFLITLMLVFMLCETAKIPRKLVAVWGEKKFTNSHIEKVLEDIRRYMVIKTWMSLLVGAMVTILLIVSKVQYPLLWGFVAFLLNYIPNIGSVVAAIPPIVLATIEHGLVVGGIDAIFFMIINCGVGYGLEPQLLGDGLDLSPLVVLLALIFFGWLLGPVGMFLSPPLAVIMKIIFQSFPETYWLAALMADRPPARVVDDAQAS